MLNDINGVQSVMVTTPTGYSVMHITNNAILGNYNALLIFIQGEGGGGYGLPMIKRLFYAPEFFCWLLSF